MTKSLNSKSVFSIIYRFIPNSTKFYGRIMHICLGQFISWKEIAIFSIKTPKTGKIDVKM